MVLWAVWRRGSAVRRPSPQSLTLRDGLVGRVAAWACRVQPSPQSLTLGDGLVGRVAAWVCRLQALPTISTPRRWPCGPCGGMGLPCAGPPHNL
jgi:hypothetical protein